ncbi:MAG TPA: M48 family metalloprotease [bacterium]|nr:M48 family metalloprotease [bacterium]HOL48114.1 M48 family metalloprotease [bacterium]HPQ18107.1 M48 family metalloprotease [bacterium]
MKTKILLLLFFIIYFFIGCSVNPVTGKKELSLMSESKEKSIGEQYYPYYTQMQDGEIQDKRLQEYVKDVGNRLAQHTHRLNLNYEFNVVNSSIPNAYAIPGGKISITRGLLMRLENEDQLAGVLAHELGHVNARHTASQYTKSILAQSLLMGVAYYLDKKDTKYKDLYLAAGAFGTQLLLLKYSRDDEREADSLGMEYMTKAGYNPQAFVDVLNVLQSLSSKEPSKWEALLSTHPLTSERIQLAQNNLNNYKEAINRPYQVNNYKVALSNLKANEEAYKLFDKGYSLYNQNKLKEAQEYFIQAINKYPEESLFYSYAGLTCLKMNDDNNALVNGINAVNLYPEFFNARFVRGISEVRLKKYSESLEDLQKANLLVPDNPLVIFYLAVALDNTGDKNNALQNYQKVLQLSQEKEIVEYAKSRIAVLSGNVR